MAPPPGSTPMKKPRTEPRSTEPQHCRQSSTGGEQPLERRLEDLPVFRGLQIAQDLGDAEEAHDHHHKVDAVRQPAHAEGEPRGSVHRIEADRPQKKTQDAHHQPLQDRFFGQIDRHHQAEKDQTEVLGGPNFRAKEARVGAMIDIAQDGRAYRR